MFSPWADEGAWLAVKVSSKGVAVKSWAFMSVKKIKFPFCPSLTV